MTSVTNARSEVTQERDEEAPKMRSDEVVIPLEAQKAKGENNLSPVQVKPTTREGDTRYERKLQDHEQTQGEPGTQDAKDAKEEDNVSTRPDEGEEDPG